MEGYPVKDEVAGAIPAPSANRHLIRYILGMDNEHIIQFFSYEHPPERLQLVSKPFHALAHQIVAELPRNPERTVALRKLLECRDSALRAYQEINKVAGYDNQ